ncbi:MAG: Ig-like domain-containing protein [Treponema sp.]|nr:Ig-like domain-containing protein [Treponema sp.]
MKKLGKLKWLWSLAAVLLLLGGMTACSSDDDDGSDTGGTNNSGIEDKMPEYDFATYTQVAADANKMYYAKQSEAVVDVAPEVAENKFVIAEGYTQTSNRFKPGMGNGNNKVMFVYYPTKLAGDFTIYAKVDAKDNTVASSGDNNGIAVGLNTGVATSDAFAYASWGKGTKFLWSSAADNVDNSKGDEKVVNLDDDINPGSTATVELTVCRKGDKIFWAWSNGTKKGGGVLDANKVVSEGGVGTGPVYAALAISRVKANVHELKVFDDTNKKVMFDLSKTGAEVVKVHAATLSVDPDKTIYIQPSGTTEVTVTSTKTSTTAEDPAGWTATSSDPSVITVTESGTNGGKATITSLKAGTVTITFVNASDPTLTKTITIAAVDYPSTNTVDLTAAVAYPAAGSTDAYTNGELSLTFDEKVAVNKDGFIRIYKKADGTLADQINFSNETQTVWSGKVLNVLGQLVRVEDKTVYVTPHNGALAAETEYFVAFPEGTITTEAGGVPKIGGVEFKGLSLSADAEKAWAFKTKADPDITKTTITVDKDASKNADYRSIQAALLAIGDQAGDYKIEVAKGTYYELLFFAGAGKANVEIEGQTTTDYGKDVMVSFANAGALGAANNTEQTRCLFDWQGGKLVLENIYFNNTFMRAGFKDATQAEAFGLDAGKGGTVAAYNCGFYSHQDTIRTIGKGWFYKCYIAGDVDFIWQESAGLTLLVEKSLIETLGDDYNSAYILAPGASQSTPAGKGTVILNSNIKLGVPSYFGRTPWPTGRYTQGAIINCTLTKEGNGSLGDALWYNASCPDDIDDAIIGWKDYGNKWADGTAVTTTDAKRTEMGSAALTDGFYNKEYSGRRAILNRVYNDGKLTVDTTATWAIDDLITAQNWTVDEDTSKQVYDDDVVSADILFDFGVFDFTKEGSLSNAVTGKTVTYKPNDKIKNEGKAHAQCFEGAEMTFGVSGNCYIDVKYYYAANGTIQAGNQNPIDFAATESAGSTGVVDTTTVTNWSGATDIVIKCTKGTSYLTAVVVRYDDTIEAPNYEVTLSDFDAAAVTLDMKDATETAPATITKTVTASGKDAATAKITYSSSNPTVATVDENGKVTAVGLGSTKIKAEENLMLGSKSYVVYVTNTAAPTKEFTIKLFEIKAEEPGDYGTFATTGGKWHDAQHGWDWGKGGTLSIPVAGSSKITLTGCNYLKPADVVATAKKADGTAIDWTETVASVQNCSGTYSFKYKKTDAAIITFTFGDTTYCPMVSVEEYVIPTYTVKLSYETKSVTYDLNSTTLSGTNDLTITGDKDKAQVTYSSDNEGVAKVDSATGAVTAVGTGEATIKALEETGEEATYVVHVSDTREPAATYSIALNKAPGKVGDYGLYVIAGSAYFNDGQHGWAMKNNDTITIPVSGASTVILGGCEYTQAGSTITVTDAAGTAVVTDLACDTTKGCAGTYEFRYTGAKTKLTIKFATSNTVYLPSIVVNGGVVYAKATTYDWTNDGFAPLAAYTLDVNGFLMSGKNSHENTGYGWCIKNGDKLQLRLSGDAIITFTGSKYSATGSKIKASAEKGTFDPAELDGNFALPEGGTDGKQTKSFTYTGEAGVVTFDFETSNTIYTPSVTVTYLHYVAAGTYDWTNDGFAPLAAYTLADNGFEMSGKNSHENTGYGWCIKNGDKLQLLVKGNATITFTGSKYSATGSKIKASAEAGSFDPAEVDGNFALPEGGTDGKQTKSFTYTGKAGVITFDFETSNTIYTPSVTIAY